MNQNNKKNFKHYLSNYRFIFFLVLGGIVMWLYFLIAAYFPILIFLIWPFVMLPAYLLNIFQNLNNLNFLNHKYFWTTTLDIGGYWNIVFVIIGILCISIIFTLLTSKREKIRKITLYSLLIFFSLGLLVKCIEYYFRYKNAISITFGDSLMILLGELSVVFTSFYILYLINNKFNLKYDLIISLKFSFTFLEILLAIFVGLILIERKIWEETAIINLYVLPLFILGAGFFFFLILELSKKYILKKLERKLRINI